MLFFGIGAVDSTVGTDQSGSGSGPGSQSSGTPGVMPVVSTGSPNQLFITLQTLLNLAQQAVRAATGGANSTYVGPVVQIDGVIGASTVASLGALQGIVPQVTFIDIRLTPDFIAANAASIVAGLQAYLGVSQPTGTVATGSGGFVTRPFRPIKVLLPPAGTTIDPTGTNCPTSSLDSAGYCPGTNPTGGGSTTGPITVTDPSGSSCSSDQLVNGMCPQSAPGGAGPTVSVTPVGPVTTFTIPPTVPTSVWWALGAVAVLGGIAAFVHHNKQPKAA